MGAGLWLGGTLAALVVGAALLSTFAGRPLPGPLMIFGIISVLCVAIIQVQDSETLDHKRLVRPWFSQRPRWIYGLSSAAFLSLQMLVVDWPQVWPGGLDSDELWGLLGFCLIALLAALIMTYLIEMLLQVGSHVWTQIKGWRKPPFEGWEHEHLSELAGPTNNFGRWPRPAKATMTLLEAEAYALLAASIASRRWVVGQLLVLVAGGGLGTSLASWASWQSDDWGVYGAMLSTVVGAFGLRFSLISVQIWEERAKAYREFVEMETIVPKRGVFAKLMDVVTLRKALDQP